jgi:hypothetical protein
MHNKVGYGYNDNRLTLTSNSTGARDVGRCVSSGHTCTAIRRTAHVCRA